MARTGTARPARERAAVVAPPAKPAGPSAALDSAVRALKRARTRLERQLTEAVQEIGMLRHFETRAAALEAEVARRDAALDELRRASEEKIRELEARLATGDSRQRSLPLLG